MQVIRLIVDRNQMRQFSIPASYGRKVEVIIRPHVEEEANLSHDSQELMKLQEQSGFAQLMLASPSEDVWNDV